MSDLDKDTVDLEAPILIEDIVPISVSVKMGGKPYVLKEASADVARRHKNIQMAAARMQDGKLVGLSGAADCEIDLVAGCLFEIVGPPGKEQERAVSPAFVRNLTNRAMKPLYARAVKISGLEDQETPEAIRKQITRLQEHLARLEANGTGDPSKNLPGHGEDTSGSPTPSDSSSTS